MTQPGWPSRLTRVVAGEIRHHRMQRGMSAQKLADRCAELGLEISRSVLADLENGRRETVTVAELLVLADALNVPPVLLLVPVGRQEGIELLPGRDALSWDAAKWVTGEDKYNDGWTPPDATAMDLFRWHERAERKLNEIARQLADRTAEEDQERVAGLVEILLNSQEAGGSELRAVRQRIRALGLVPPQLPRELAYIESEAGGAAITAPSGDARIRSRKGER